MHVSVVGLLLVVAAPLIKNAIVVYRNAKNSWKIKNFHKSLVIYLELCLLIMIRADVTVLSA